MNSSDTEGMGNGSTLQGDSDIPTSNDTSMDSFKDDNDLRGKMNHFQDEVQGNDDRMTQHLLTNAFEQFLETDGPFETNPFDNKERRNLHNVKERLRRAEQMDLFGMLKEKIGGRINSKRMILEKARQYVLNLRHVERVLKAQQLKEHTRNQKLQARLNKLVEEIYGIPPPTTAIKLGKRPYSQVTDAANDRQPLHTPVDPAVPAENSRVQFICFPFEDADEDSQNLVVDEDAHSPKLTEATNHVNVQMDNSIREDAPIPKLTEATNHVNDQVDNFSRGPKLRRLLPKLIPIDKEVDEKKVEVNATLGRELDSSFEEEEAVPGEPDIKMEPPEVTMDNFSDAEGNNDTSAEAEDNERTAQTSRCQMQSQIKTGAMENHSFLNGMLIGCGDGMPPTDCDNDSSEEKAEEHEEEPISETDKEWIQNTKNIFKDIDNAEIIDIIGNEKENDMAMEVIEVDDDKYNCLSMMANNADNIRQKEQILMDLIKNSSSIEDVLSIKEVHEVMPNFFMDTTSAFNLQLQSETLGKRLPPHLHTLFPIWNQALQAQMKNSPQEIEHVDPSSLKGPKLDGISWKSAPTITRVIREKYGGSPSELPLTRYPTYADVARYFYLTTDTQRTYITQIIMVKRALILNWKKRKPDLPLRESLSLHAKLHRFLKSIIQYNGCKIKVNSKDHYDAMEDMMFDIAACTCLLPQVPCESPEVNCKAEKCSAQHIVCTCEPDKRMPMEEREFFRKQRFERGILFTHILSKKNQKRKKGGRSADDQGQEQPPISKEVGSLDAVSQASASFSNEVEAASVQTQGSENAPKIHRISLEDAIRSGIVTPVNLRPSAPRPARSLLLPVSPDIVGQELFAPRNQNSVAHPRLSLADVSKLQRIVADGGVRPSQQSHHASNSIGYARINELLRKGHSDPVAIEDVALSMPSASRNIAVVTSSASNISGRQLALITSGIHGAQMSSVLTSSGQPMLVATSQSSRAPTSGSESIKPSVPFPIRVSNVGAMRNVGFSTSGVALVAGSRGVLSVRGSPFTSLLASATPTTAIRSSLMSTTSMAGSSSQYFSGTCSGEKDLNYQMSASPSSSSTFRMRNQKNFGHSQTSPVTVDVDEDDPDEVVVDTNVPTPDDKASPSKSFPGAEQAEEMDDEALENSLRAELAELRADICGTANIVREESEDSRPSGSKEKSKKDNIDSDDNTKEDEAASEGSEDEEYDPLDHILEPTSDDDEPEEGSVNERNPACAF